MLKVRNITDVQNMSVYTDDGAFFGIIEESVIEENKVSGWKVKASKGSLLTRVLGGAKGVIVPHQFVKSIDNIMIVSRAAVPAYAEEEEDTKT